jgi:YfiH family protein
VAAAHAGWRGLAAGILQDTVAAMAAPPADILAWLGPAISAANFEVGGEVRDIFLAADPDAAAAFAPNARGRWQADLYALGRRALAAAGVSDVFGAGVCTYAESDRYFSHRRAAPCGRMATLIWREA